MDHTVLIATLGTAVGLVATVSGMAWKMTTEVRDHCDIAQKRMFERFDEFKGHMETTHTRREVCEVLHEQLRADITEMKSDIKEVLKISRNGGGH